VHREAQGRRANAHELVGYLREAGVVHVLAHPIYAMPGPLDRRAVEKRLVMFGLWEFINGSRPAQQNRLACEIAEGVGRIELRQMAMRHGLPVPPHHRISGTGGSDDHGGIYGGVTHTVLPRVESTKEVLEAIAAGEVRPAGEDGTVAKMVHTGFRLAGAAIEEGEDGRAVRVLRGLALNSAFLRRSHGAPPGAATELLKNVPLLSRLKETRIRAELTRRYEVLKNGVDNELFDPAKRDPDLRDSLGGGRTLLLYAGRVSCEKGLDRLASGYLALRRRRDDVRLVVAGDGPNRGELETLLGGTATFTGFLQGEELACLYASCDVFVFPSTTDTLGRAVAEAQASGLPAVVCGMGGPRECIRPGVSGFVAHPDDEQAYFSKIELLLEDPRLRERMGRAAREFAGGMSWEAVLDGLIELHSRLAGMRPDSDVYARS
jgi:hypothetical protein